MKVLTTAKSENVDFLHATNEKKIIGYMQQGFFTKVFGG